MDSRGVNGIGEFEPRTVPRQFLAATTETVPSVPEVSLAFDAPRQVNPHPDEAIAFPRSSQDSYAVWKQKVPPTHTYTNNYSHASISQRPQVNQIEMPNRREAMISASPLKKSSNSLKSSNSSNSSKSSKSSKSAGGQSPNSYTRDSRLKFYQKIPSEPPASNNQMNPLRSAPTPSIERSIERPTPKADRNSQALVTSSDLVMKSQLKVSKNDQLERNCDHYSNQSANEDIIKQLLCLVQSQNAQIQLLQAQVETLLSVRTENPRKLQEYTKKTPVNLPLNNVNNVSTNTSDLVPQNSQMYKTPREPPKSDENQRDEKNQKLVNEKKVSIGVMTSFELTVQEGVIYNVENAPNNVDYPPKNCDSLVNRSQQVETLNSIKNTPRGPLEQIVEDSESHLSSAIQASNNYRTCSSAKKSLQVTGEGEKSRFDELSAVNCHFQGQGTPPTANFPLQVENLPQKMVNSHKNSLIQANELQSSARPRISSVNARDNAPVPVDTSITAKKTPKVGWTLYDNVMCQVNEILHNTQEAETAESRRSVEVIQEIDQSQLLLNELQQSTIEQLKLFGLTFAENSGYSGGCGASPLNISRKLPLDTSYYPRLDYQANFLQNSNSGTDSSTSMHMKALASKYLGIKQFPSGSTHQKGIEMITNMVVNRIQNNISLTSINEVPKIDGDQQHHRLQKAQADFRNRDNYMINAKRNPQNILDISSLKRQPKLL